MQGVRLHMLQNAASYIPIMPVALLPLARCVLHAAERSACSSGPAGNKASCIASAMPCAVSCKEKHETCAYMLRECMRLVWLIGQVHTASVIAACNVVLVYSRLGHPGVMLDYQEARAVPPPCFLGLLLMLVVT